MPWRQASFELYEDKASAVKVADSFRRASRHYDSLTGKMRDRRYRVRRIKVRPGTRYGAPGVAERTLYAGFAYVVEGEYGV